MASYDGKIEIRESGDRLETLSSREFVLDPKYYKWGYNRSDEIKIRSKVADMLRLAQQKMQKIKGHEGWKFKIWDAYRPLSTQLKLYVNLRNELKEKNPEWTEEQVVKATTKYVNAPSLDPASPPPHNTGGTVDLTLVDSEGNEIPMGTKFDEFNDRAFTDHFKDGTDDIKSLPEGTESYSPEECKNFHKNRMFLKQVLEDVGFTNYYEEWWHFSYGNQEWAGQKGEDFAIYGSMELV